MNHILVTKRHIIFGRIFIKTKIKYFKLYFKYNKYV